MGDVVGLAWVDISTGRFRVMQAPIEKTIDELNRIAPAELLWAEEWTEKNGDLGLELEREFGSRLSPRPVWRFAQDSSLRALHRQFQVKSLEGFGLPEESAMVPAAGALIEYLEETQRGSLRAPVVDRGR